MIKEDEGRLMRVVLDVRNVNILITFWHDVQAIALEDHRITDASMATAYIKALNDARKQHGLGPFEIGERPDTAKDVVTNEQPEGDA